MHTIAIQFGLNRVLADVCAIQTDNNIDRCPVRRLRKRRKNKEKIRARQFH
jgi:hypothetical protein